MQSVWGSRHTGTQPERTRYGGGLEHRLRGTMLKARSYLMENRKIYVSGPVKRLSNETPNSCL